MNNEIQVLWVDDHDNKYFRLNAEKKEIKITRFECWNDAKKELDANPGKYEVLLLDCMCKYDSNDIPNDSFLTQAIGDKDQNIPWLIFTAGADKELEDIVRRLPPRWKEWSPKGYYRKSEKGIEEELFLIIKQIANGNPVRKIYNKYKDIFTIIEKKFSMIAEDLEKIITNEILKRLEIDDTVEGVEKNIRTVLEKFIEYYLKIGLLPKDFEIKHGVNIKNSIMYLFNEKSLLYQHIYRETDSFTRRINSTLLNMYEYLSEDVHGKSYFDEAYNHQIKKHELIACCLKLFEIFKWYDKWHTEKESDLENISKEKLSVKVERIEPNQLFCSWKGKKVSIASNLKLSEGNEIFVLDVSQNKDSYWLKYFQKIKDA